MKSLKAIYFLGMAVTFVMGAAFSSCSTKKNTAYSRQWQAFNTRYNVYFNGEQHFIETLEEMERNYEDDYSLPLTMHPAEAFGNMKYPQPSGDFTRTIEKMQKAIELHSITRKPAQRTSSQKERDFRAREEFNPFLHNAWLTMGKARFFNGDFSGAASTFTYVAKHFKWLPATVTEALLWEARSYLALGLTYEAENALHPVKESDIKNKNIRDLYNFVMADYLIATKRLNEAAGYLQEAAKDAHGSQKNRLWFLLGQLYESIGQTSEAYNAFKMAEGGPSTPYRTKFNARIKQSEVFTGGNFQKEVKSLQAMTRYQRNKEYLDRIYYAIGNIYLNRKDTTDAIEYYEKAVKESQNLQTDMALAQLALGNIFFAKKEYVKAQPHYAQAIPFLPDNYPDYKILKNRSDILDRLALYAGNVAYQDSLLALSRLPREEQIKIAEKQLAEFLKEEKLAQEEARREEYLATTGQTSTGESGTIPVWINKPTDDSWYFYNKYTVNAGKNAFQKKWGARKLEDDWRRKNKNSFSFDEFDYSQPDDFGSDDKDNGDLLSNEPSNNFTHEAVDPHNIQYYLNKIPSTDSEIKIAEDIIQEGLYKWGLILKDELEDYPEAQRVLNDLDSRYPDNPYRLETLYNLYIMAALENNTGEAERLRKEIVSKFPSSFYGQAMKDPDYFNNLKKMNEVQEQIYEKAYQAYLENDNKTVHSLTHEMETKYPLSSILPKFVFIDALAYFTDGDNDKFKSRLTELLSKWPDTDMTDMATSILRGMKEGKNLYNTGSNTRSELWQLRLKDSLEEDMDETLVAPDFQPEPDAPHYLVFAFPRYKINPNKILFDVAKFNFSTFLVKDFDLEQMNFSDMGLLIVKGFSNLKEVEYYRAVMTREGPDLGKEVLPVMISKDNFEKLLREGRSFEEYFEKIGEQPPFPIPEMQETTE